MSTTFKEKLLLFPTDYNSLPSPNRLLNKIIIKGKSFQNPFTEDKLSALEGDVSDEDEAAEMDKTEILKNTGYGTGDATTLKLFEAFFAVPKN